MSRNVSGEIWITGAMWALYREKVCRVYESPTDNDLHLTYYSHTKWNCKGGENSTSDSIQYIIISIGMFFMTRQAEIGCGVGLNQIFKKRESPLTTESVLPLATWVQFKQKLQSLSLCDKLLNSFGENQQKIKSEISPRHDK